jgi:hypothetical protein
MRGLALAPGHLQAKYARVLRTSLNSNITGYPPITSPLRRSGVRPEVNDAASIPDQWLAGQSKHRFRAWADPLFF